MLAGDAHISGGMASTPAERILATTSTNEQLLRSRPPSSVLDIVIDNPFGDSQLFVWIDDNLLLQDALHVRLREASLCFAKLTVKTIGASMFLREIIASP
jgi:hypothetical protein